MKHNISTKKSKEFTPNSSKLIIIDHNWHYYVISEVPYVISENSYVISEARRFPKTYVISGGMYFPKPYPIFEHRCTSRFLNRDIISGYK